MQTAPPIDLVDMFPKFSVFTRRAHAFLTKCHVYDISKQLSDCNIDRVYLTETPDMETHSKLEVIQGNRYSGVISTSFTPTEQAEELGYLIGEVQHHNLCHVPWTNLVPEADPAEIEEFRRTFARLWVEINGVHKIVSWIEMNKFHKM